MSWKDTVKNTNWLFLWAREYGILRMDNFLRGHVHSTAYIGRKPSHTVAIWHDGITNFYVDSGEWGKILSAIFERVQTWKKYQKFEKIVLKDFSGFLKFSEKIPQNLESLNNYGLIKLLESYDQAHALTGAAQYLVFYANELLSEKMEEIISAKTNNPEALMILTQPTVPPAVAQLEMELLKARTKFQDGSFEAQLDKIYQRFFWIPANDPVLPPWTFEKFLKDNEATLKEPDPASRLRKLQKNQNQLRQKQKKLLQEWKLSPEERDIFRVFFRLIIWKDLRDNYRGEAFARSRPLFKQIGARLGLSWQEVQYFTNEEIVRALRKNQKLDPLLAQRRRKLALLFCQGKKTYIREGEGTKDLIKHIEGVKAALVDSVSGIIGSPGKAKGQAKIVLTRQDLSKIKRGDILVAKTTHPDFVPTMKLCKAIVTDEGGITCHAAIVSRELKIPCVVGTKLATKIFKDGDIIEVDANKGIVRKIK